RQHSQRFRSGGDDGRRQRQPSGQSSGLLQRGSERDDRRVLERVDHVRHPLRPQERDMKNHATYQVSVVVALVAAASPAAAVTTICVTPPTITTCPNHTIGAAITAAGPGDII